MHQHKPVIDKVWTIIDLIRWGTTYFSEHQISSPRLTIELMLCSVLNVQRITLYSDHERPLAKDELAILRTYVKRRVHHEPLQYILGKAEFYGYTFHVTPSVLIPRPETELLVEHVINWAKGKGTIECLDIGTGTGCIPISSAKHLPESRWYAVDVADDILEVARGNAIVLEVVSNIRFEKLDVLAQPLTGSYDVITMNPPYIPQPEVPTLQAEVRDYEPHRALTDDGNGYGFYEWMSEQVATLLKPDGILVMEIGFGQQQYVTELFKRKGLSVHIKNDLDGIPRIVAVENI